MNAKKLQLGNRLKYSTAKVWRKEIRGTEFDLTINDLIHIESNPKDGIFEPIELNEALLLYRCGFQKEASRYGKMEIKCLYQLKILQNSATLYLRTAGSLGYFWGFLIEGKSAELDACASSIKYLHELQNLLSAFGHELIIEKESEQTLFTQK